MWNTAGVSGSGGFDLLMQPCYIRNGYSQLGRTNLHPPSAQLIEPSAVALLAAVRDHFQKLIVGPQKTKAPPSGAEGDARGGICLGSDRPDTLCLSRLK